MLEYVDEGARLVVKFTIPRLDILKSSELHQELLKILAKENRDIYLDVSELDFIDSAILGVFVRVNDVANRTGKKITFKNLSEYVQNMFRNSAMHRVLRVEGAT